MDLVWSGEHFSVVRSESEYEAVDQKDSVLALPKVNEEYIIRLEKCPPYKVKDPGRNDKFYTMISGTVEENEKPLKTLRREMGEETPIRPNKVRIIDRREKIPFVKFSTQRVNVYHFEVLDYEKTQAEGDGSKIEDESDYKRVTYEELQDLALNSDKADFTIQYAANVANPDDI